MRTHALIPRIWVAYLLTMLVPLQLAAQPTRQLQGTVVEFPNLDPVELGWGWDERRAGSPRQTCIDFRPAKEFYIDKRMSMQLANDHESLSRALNVSVAGKMKSMSGAKFSASASFAHSATLSSTGEHVAMLAEVLTAPQFVAPLDGPDPKASALSTSAHGSKVDMRSFYRGGAVRLKENLRRLASTDPVEFVKACGTSFIAVIHSGARINGLMTFREVETKDRQELKAAAKGSGAGFSMNASMNSLVEKYSKIGKLEIKFEQLGGSAKNFPMDKTALLAVVSGLPAEAAAQPRPFLMVIQSYSSLPDWPDKVPLPELTDEEVLTRAYFRIITLMGFANEALHNPGFLLKFDTSRAEVANLYDRMLGEKNQLRNLVLNCQQGQCDARKWRDWSDMPYRARMPMPGGFGTLSFPIGPDALGHIPRLVADRRISRWIVEPDQWRCQYEGECMKQADIELYREGIEKAVAKSLGL